jgi:hypothetical protein
MGLGAACLTETGKDIIVTKDKDVEAETDAERKNGIPSSMGVWRLKLSSHPEVIGGRCVLHEMFEIRQKQNK